MFSSNLRVLFFLTTITAASSGVLFAQQPVDDLSPVPGAPIGGSPDVIGQCDITEAAINITTPTADVRILGGCQALSAGKWVFGGGNTTVIGDERIYFFPIDQYLRPDTSTFTFIPAQGTFPSGPGWGARDWGWDSVVGRAYHGDEADNLWEVDPFAETYTTAPGTPFATLTGLTLAIIRSVAVKTDPSMPNILHVVVGDFAGPLQYWTIDRANGNLATNTGITFPNPGAPYGSCFAKNGTVLLVFGQAQTPCFLTPGGLHKITAYDFATGVPGWFRGGDANIPGASPNTAGGIAGGMEMAIVSGQEVIALTHQAANDSIGFVPFTGFANLGAPDCGGSRVIPFGNSELGNLSYGLELRAGPSFGVSYVVIAFPPAYALSVGGCIIDADFNIPIILLPVPLDAFGNTGVIPIGIPFILGLDGLVVIVDTGNFDGFGALTSSETMTVTLSVPMF